MLPFKDQKSANAVRKQLSDLSRKVKVDISPVYTSRKIKDEIKVREDKPPLVNQYCVVNHIRCDLCHARYVGYTFRHLHQQIEEHKGSAVGNHLREQHDLEPDDITQSFRILKKCHLIVLFSKVCIMFLVSQSYFKMALYSFFEERRIGTNATSARVFLENFYFDDETKNKDF